MAIVVTDADACIPAALREGMPLVVAPPDAPLLLESESVPRLRLEVAPPDPAPVAAACAEAAAGSQAVLYVPVGDQYGSNEEVVNRARAAAGPTGGPAGEAHAFFLHESGSALMGAGWQAVAAARALHAGASVEIARDAAAMVSRHARVLAALEHPEFAGVDTFDEVRRVRLRVLADLHGPEVDVLGQVPRRDALLVALRDRFRAEVEREFRAEVEREAEGAAGETAGGAALHVAVHHAGAEPGAQALATWIRRELAPQELWVAPLTRHAATRTGPRMLGIAWYRDPA